MDNDHFLHEALNENARLLLECNDNIGQMKLAVDRLYQIYSRITGVTVDCHEDDKEIILPTGKAISTPAAAHCLLEMKRTALFLRGIHKAISLKLSENKIKPIRILYAGTGPFGTLLVPLLPLYKPGEVQVDLLDIQQSSLVALLELTGKLGLEEYIDEVYNADATDFNISKRYDIVICETMLACLRSEPQVAIMQNLIPQLDKACIFIPEEISIDACLTNPKMEMERMLYYENEAPVFERKLLGNVFTINKLNLENILSHIKITIPDDMEAFPVLKLFTTVHIFGNEVLTDNDSSITLPKQFYDFRKQRAREVEFWYVQGEKPKIESSITELALFQEFITTGLS